MSVKIAGLMTMKIDTYISNVGLRVMLQSARKMQVRGRSPRRVFVVGRHTGGVRDQRF